MLQASSTQLVGFARPAGITEMQHQESLHSATSTGAGPIESSPFSPAEQAVRQALQDIRNRSALRFCRALALWRILCAPTWQDGLPLTPAAYASFHKHGWTRAQANQAVDDLVDADMAKISYLPDTSTLTVRLACEPGMTLSD